jgi:hypothetical protein
MRVTKEMTKPLLADMKLVVRQGKTDNKYEVVLKSGVLRLKWVLNNRTSDETVIDYLSTEKFIKMVEKAIETKTLGDFSKTFPDSLIHYLENNIVDTDLKDASKNVFNRVKRVNSHLVRTDVLLKELKPIDDKALNITYKLFISGDLYKLLIKPCGENKVVEQGITDLLLNVPKTYSNFEGKLLKLARNNNLQLERLLYLLDRSCEFTLESTYKLITDLTDFKGKKISVS